MQYNRRMNISNFVIIAFSIMLSASASFAVQNSTDCSRLSSVNFKTTLNEVDIGRFNAWKEDNFANLNTCQSRKLEFERLQQRYCTGGRDIYKMMTDVSWEALSLSVAGGLAFLCSKFLAPAAAAVPAAVAPVVGPVGITGILIAIAPSFQSFASRVVSSLRESKMDLNEGLKYVQDKLVSQSASKVEELPEDIKQKIHSFDRSIRTLLAQKSGEEAFKYMKRREQVYLAFPTKTLNVSHRDRAGNKEIKSIIDQRVQDLIARYPEDQRLVLELLVSAIRHNSVAVSGTRVQAYLYGPPGTGKTTFVKQLGEALGVPICSISMSSLEPAQLLGQELGDDHVQKSDDEVLGKIAACYTNSGYKNPIIFFDEAGEYLSDSNEKTMGFDLNYVKKQQIQGEFKKITDPSSAFIKHTGLGIEIDTSRSTFLFASNYPLTNLALLNRIPQISLSRLTRSEKEVAALGSMEQSLCEISQFLEDKAVDAIRKVVIEYLPYILEVDQNKNPGARTIQLVIGEFVAQVDCLQEQERITGIVQISKELLEKRILGSFERREAIPANATGNEPHSCPHNYAN